MLTKNKSAYTELIRSPRITEKAASLGVLNAYTFNVAPHATKSEIAKAVKSLYKVTPRKIAIITIKMKRVFVRGKKGTRSGGKKAVVYLKKGEAINI